MNNNKTLFTIPLVSIWYIIITLIFILMRVTNIISWSPLWILSPLWLPTAFCICFYIVYVVLLLIVNIMNYIYKIYNKIRYK